MIFSSIFNKIKLKLLKTYKNKIDENKINIDIKKSI
jgi:hypothetical protein